MSCGGDDGDEPEIDSQKNKSKIVEGTITVNYMDRHTGEQTFYAALGSLETKYVDGDFIPVKDGYEGNIDFFTKLFDEETIQKVAGKNSTIAAVTLINSYFIEFYFQIQNII